MKKKLCIILAAAMLLSLVWTGSAFADVNATFSATASAATVAPGDTFDVTVSLAAGVDVAGYQVNLNYDSGKLDYVDCSDIGDGVTIRKIRDGFILILGIKESDMSDTPIVSANTTAQAGKIKFRVKDEVSGAASFSFSGADVSNATTRLPLSPDELTLAGTSVTVEEKPAASSDASLKSLAVAKETTDIAAVSFTPAFSPDTLSYRMWVPYRMEEVKFDAVPTDPDATVTISETALEAGKENTITITVTAADGETTRTYSVSVVRSAVSADASLKSLVPSAGTLSPEFDPGKIEYTLALPENVGEVSFKVEKNFPMATVDMPSKVTVAAGQTEIVRITVTAENGTAKTIYTIKVTRQGGGAATGTPETTPPTTTAPPATTPPAAVTTPPAAPTEAPTEAPAETEDPATQQPDETDGPEESQLPNESEAPTTDVPGAVPTESPSGSTPGSETQAPAGNSGNKLRNTLIWIVIIVAVILVAAIGVLIFNTVAGRNDGGDDPDDHNDDDSGADDGEPPVEEPKPRDPDMPYRTR